MKNHDPIKVYDARWETDEFSKQEIMRFFESVYIYGRELGADTVTITRDARNGAGEVMEIAADIGVDSGFNVYLCTDPASTPMSYYFALKTSLKHPKTMGLTITASHNPGNYIGLKITVPVVRAIGLDSGPLGGFTRIREIYYSREKLSCSRKGGLVIVNPLEEYITYSMEKAGVNKNSLKGITVVLNSFSGSAGPELFKAYRYAGIRVFPLLLIPDGNFPAGAPNPISRGKMDSAVSAAHRNKGAIVIGTDGDGDRIVFGNERGILNAGFASLPIVYSLIKGAGQTAAETVRGKGYENRIIYDPKVSPLALFEWKNAGITPYLFRNGHSQIKEYMNTVKAVAAVEESGHFYHNLSLNSISMYGENSIFTTLLFLKAFKDNPSIIDRLRALQDSVFTTGEFNFKFKNDRTRDTALKKITGTFEKEENVETAYSTKEGIDLQGTVISRGLNLNSPGKKLTGTWYSGYFRSSTNEKAILRAYISASNAGIGRQIERKVMEISKQYGGTETE
ncbi:MAG: hypothetical protein GXP33_12775 [Spirochaetes bacterium]|nr:hypothetical protein [Spirochaetota bacterium]